MEASRELAREIGQGQGTASEPAYVSDGRRRWCPGDESCEVLSNHKSVRVGLGWLKLFLWVCQRDALHSHVANAIGYIQLMSKTIQLIAADGHQLEAYVARPSGDSKAGLVVLQEAFGVNAHIRRVADSYAEDGFVAIAPALFDRIQRGVELGYEGEERAQGLSLARQIDPNNALKDVSACLAWLQQQGLGKNGVIGYCLGGSIAWLSATRLSPAAVVGYYGGQIAKYVDETPHCPVMLHFGSLDKHIPKADIDRLQVAHPEVQIFWYDADHGFNCDARASFNATAAALARARSLDFLRKQLTA